MKQQKNNILLNFHYAEQKTELKGNLLITTISVDISINNQCTLKNRILIKKINDVEFSDDHIITNILLTLIDYYVKMKAFNNFNTQQDVFNFITTFNYETEKGLEKIEEVKNVVNNLKIDLSDEELEECQKAYSSSSEEDFEKVKPILKKVFEISKDSILSDPNKERKLVLRKINKEEDNKKETDEKEQNKINIPSKKNEVIIKLLKEKNDEDEDEENKEKVPTIFTIYCELIINGEVIEDFAVTSINKEDPGFEKCIKEETAFRLIEIYSILKKFNFLKSLDDISNFTKKIKITDQNEILKILKQFRKIAKSLQLDMSDEEISKCEEFYFFDAEEDYEYIENLLNRNFIFKIENYLKNDKK